MPKLKGTVQDEDGNQFDAVLEFTPELGPPIPPTPGKPYSPEILTIPADDTVGLELAGGVANFHLLCKGNCRVEPPVFTEPGTSGVIVFEPHSPGKKGVVTFDAPWKLLGGQSARQELGFALAYYCVSDGSVIGTVWR